ncbi:MAG: glycosyltransferase family 4 protein [Phycisphaerae bacterium]|jgi:glycosyltransferase involved in cell wall biosynthesis
MREARSLMKQGHEVSLVAMHDPAKKLPEGLKILPLDEKQRSRWERVLLMRQTYKLGRQSVPDVYHVHEVESLAVGVLLKWVTGARLIFDAHECFHFTAARFSKGLLGRVITWLTARGLRWAARRADHVIVVSYTNERFYRDFCGCRKVTIIHNSPPTELFPHTNKPPEAAITLTHDGRLSVNRGQNQMLDALAIVKKERPVRLLVVGQVLGPDKELFERRVQELGLQNEVEVTGWLPYEQVGPALNRGSIGVVAMQPSPNNYGSLSNKLFSYMCTGQAVIGPRGSDTEVVINQTRCGLAVDMTDPAALAEAILSLLRDPERTQELGRNARQAVETGFGWTRMESLLAEIYAGLGR